MKKILSLLLAGGMMLTTLTACGTKQQTATVDSAAKQTQAYETGLFDTSYVHKINVEISDEDWKDLRENPLQKAKYQVNVTIDNDTVENVSFAAKGNTSLSQVASSDSDRYSFKINFGKYEDGQTYQGLDKLNLNNIMSDATYIKDYLSYLLMRKTGVSASLTSFVELSINGEVHGLYIAIEDVSDSFLERNTGSDSGALYKPETDRLDNMDNKGPDASPDEAGMPQGGMQPPTDESGNIQMPGDGDQQGTPPQMPNGNDQQGTPPQMPNGNDQQGTPPQIDANGADLVYSDDSKDSYSDIFDNEENDVTEDDEKELIAAIKALNSGEGIDDSWDMDQIIRYFVAHNFVLNYDSYTGIMLHNYYLYETEGKVTVFPWDYNLAFCGFQGGNDATAAVNWAIDSPLSGTTEEKRPLWNVIVSNDEYLKLYHQYYSELMSGFFTNGECAAEIERVYEMIRPYVESDPTAFYTVEEFDEAVDTLKQFCELRSQSVVKQLSGELGSTSDTQNAEDKVDASNLTLSKTGTQSGGKAPDASR